jgi:hypothetical protein
MLLLLLLPSFFAFQVYYAIASKLSNILAITAYTERKSKSGNKGKNPYGMSSMMETEMEDQNTQKLISALTSEVWGG